MRFSFAHARELIVARTKAKMFVTFIFSRAEFTLKSICIQLFFGFMISLIRDLIIILICFSFSKIFFSTDLS